MENSKNIELKEIEPHSKPEVDHTEDNSTVQINKNSRRNSTSSGISSIISGMSSISSISNSDNANDSNSNSQVSITKSNSSNEHENKDLGENSINDDSVIFVQEIISSENNFIAIRKNNKEKPMHKKESKRSKKLNKRLQRKLEKTLKDKSKSNALKQLNAKECKVLEKYNGNTYNPNRVKKCESAQNTEVKTGKKRMVIIDGNNVAYAHSLNKHFSVKGLEICINYFQSRGHEVKAVVPQNRLKQKMSSDPKLLDTLYKNGVVVLTPCKNLPGKSSMSYDDRFVLQLAIEFDAAIISNDNYRDLLNESDVIKHIIENRVIGYSWCNDVFIIPRDPYGRFGPSSDFILSK